METHVDRTLNLDMNIFCLLSVLSLALGFTVAFVNFFVEPELGPLILLLATTALLCQIRGQATRMLVREASAFDLGREVESGGLGRAEGVRPLR